MGESFLPQLYTLSCTIQFIASQMQKRPQFLILSSSFAMANISPISAGRCQNGKIMSSNWATTLHLLPGFKCIFYRSSQEWYFLERKKNSKFNFLKPLPLLVSTFTVTLSKRTDSCVILKLVIQHCFELKIRITIRWLLIYLSILMLYCTLW